MIKNCEAYDYIHIKFKDSYVYVMKEGLLMEYDGFISYRRSNGFLMAQVIHDRLLECGIKTFLDLEELRSGDFNEDLYTAIENSPNFIVILPPNSLNRCKSEKDWLRKEIIHAVKHNKKIIPVLCDGFKWPSHWNESIPEEVRSLERYNGVKSSQDYLSAMIDKLIDFMVDIRVEKPVKDSTARDNMSTMEYLQKSTENVSNIDCFDMSFHAGAEWFTDIKKNDILYKLIQSEVKIRIIINDVNASEMIASHMRHERKSYVSFNDCINYWLRLRKEYPNNVEIRISSLPILRRYYSFHMKNKSIDTVNVKYYTYANSDPDNNYQPVFSAGSPYFLLYRDEFDYLWNNAAKESPKSFVINKHYMNTAEFFEQYLERIELGNCVDLAFRAGSEWHYKEEILNVLQFLVKMKTKIRVLVNSSDTVQDLSSYMRQPLKKYYGYENSLLDWIEKSKRFPDCITVRIANVPLMHRYYCIRDEETNIGVCKVSYYTYGNYMPKNDYQHLFNDSNSEYKLYKEEFEYIWNNASKEPK